MLNRILSCALATAWAAAATSAPAYDPPDPSDPPGDGATTYVTRDGPQTAPCSCPCKRAGKVADEQPLRPNEGLDFGETAHWPAN